MNEPILIKGKQKLNILIYEYKKKLNPKNKIDQ